MAGETQTISEYIVHHLTNLTYGKLPGGFEREDGTIVAEGGAWVMAHGGDEAAVMGFNAIHVDSMIWSVGLGIIFCWLFRGVARKAESGVQPGSVPQHLHPGAVGLVWQSDYGVSSMTRERSTSVPARMSVTTTVSV